MDIFSEYNLSNKLKEVVDNFESEKFNSAMVQALISNASEIIAPYWSLKTFIAVNPLKGFEDQHFLDAAKQAKKYFSANCFLKKSKYLELYDRGEISLAALNEHFEKMLEDIELDIRVLDKEINLKKLLWEIFFSRELEFKNLANPSVYPHSRRVESGDLLGDVNNYMIKIFNHFFDEGISVWQMPNREKGFYAAWKALALYDSDLKLDKHLKEWFEQLPDCPERALIVLLDSLGIKREDWEEYLKASLAALPGWASFIKWRHLYAHIPEYKKYPASKLEYLAVRLCVEAIFLFDYFRVNNIQLTCFEELERLLAKQVLTKKFKSPEELERERYLFTDEKLKTTLANLYYADFSLLTDKELTLIRAPLNLFLEKEAMIWLSAWEDSFQKPIIDGIYRNHWKSLMDGKSILSNSSSLFLNLSKSKQLAQMVFCIDVRSEGIRRCIEADSRIETLGFAGFFGLPISYKEYDSAEFKDACPVLIKPKHFIDEQVHSSCSHKLEQHEYSNSLLKTIFNVYKALKANIASAFIFAEASGPLYMLSMMIRTLTPSLNALLSRISAAIKPKISFEPMLDVKDTVINAASTPDEDLSSSEVKRMFTGLAKKEQLLFSEMALRLMGLTQNFAPLVVFSGHGSTTENNPYASALDCGACAGNHGGVNAKALAKILNKQEIRSELAKRGINIPDSTLFIGAEHNTTTDDFEFYDYELKTSEQRKLLADLQESLLQAKKENNAIRQLSFLSSRESESNINQDVEIKSDNGTVEGTAHKRASSRLRRTNDRSALRVHEDHEDDENAEIGVCEQSLRRSMDWSEVRPEWGLAGNTSFIIGPRHLSKGLDLSNRAFMHSYDWTQDFNGLLLETIMTAPMVVTQWINSQYYFSTVDNVNFGSGSKITHNIVGNFGVMQGNASDLYTGLALQSVMSADDELYHRPLRLRVFIFSPIERVKKIIFKNTILQNLFYNEWIRLVVLDPNTNELSSLISQDYWKILKSDNTIGVE
ncbi:MAG: DUF2309 domain-containing protein [Candidatus Melainabacteria bacterium]|nr:DUF2309 domain-containing protein [Candidatus Melainabacteria bacterium]